MKEEKIRARFIYDLPREFVAYCIKNALDEETREKLKKLLRDYDEEATRRFSLHFRPSA